MLCVCVHVCVCALDQILPVLTHYVVSCPMCLSLSVTVSDTPVHVKKHVYSILAEREEKKEPLNPPPK